MPDEVIVFFAAFFIAFALCFWLPLSINILSRRRLSKKQEREAAYLQLLDATALAIVMQLKSNAMHRSTNTLYLAACDNVFENTDTMQHAVSAVLRRKLAA